jgi:hypothetical protein
MVAIALAITPAVTTIGAIAGEIPRIATRIHAIVVTITPIATWIGPIALAIGRIATRTAAIAFAIPPIVSRFARIGLPTGSIAMAIARKDAAIGSRDGRTASNVGSYGPPVTSKYAGRGRAAASQGTLVAFPLTPTSIAWRLWHWA